MGTAKITKKNLRTCKDCYKKKMLEKIFFALFLLKACCCSFFFAIKKSRPSWIAKKFNHNTYLYFDKLIRNKLTKKKKKPQRSKVVFVSIKIKIYLFKYLFSLLHCDIRPFFFENEQEEAVTVNDDRYRAMLNEFLFTKIDGEDIGNIWFQQDRATCHTAEATLVVLRPVFEDRIISCRADVVSPP